MSKSKYALEKSVRLFTLRPSGLRHAGIFAIPRTFQNLLVGRGFYVRGGILSQCRRLFAVGSLCEGMVHFSKIADFVQASEPATVLSCVYRLQVGFPVLVNEARGPVHGSLLVLDGPDTFWALLDEFHGYNLMLPEQSLFLRTSAEVATADGSSVSADIYFINPQKIPPTAALIEDGNWEGALIHRPALTSRLTERQVTYIRRLGSSTGREIVPIDLSLYRELMHLELIVDKGRRLALSRLGQEVYRFLA